MLADFTKEVEVFRKMVSKSTAININSQKIKNCAIEVVKNFFSKYQDYLTENNLLDENALELTDCLQELLRLTQGNNPKKTYLTIVKTIEKRAKELNIKDVVRPSGKGMHVQQNDQLLITTLEQIVPTAALSYKQALLDLNASDNKLSFRGTATELREALREILDHLAPDKDVMIEPGFKLEQGRVKPTMKQKVRYILKSRNLAETKRIPAEKSAEMIDEIIGQIARATYDRASLSTHVQTTRREVYQIKRYIDLVFHEVLEL